MQQQFYRMSILLGDDKVANLANRHVLIAGAGGVGGNAIEAIARAGIGNITIIDNDIVDITNINRQLIATVSTIGKQKVAEFKNRILDINPRCHVIAINEFITAENVDSLIAKNIDYVIDCIDTVQSKIALIKYCYQNKIAIVSAMGAGNRYDVTRVKIDDISKTKVCGLARTIRLKLRQLGISKGLTVVYSDEEGSKPLPQDIGRPINGTISYLPGLFGMMLAGYVIKSLVNK